MPTLMEYDAASNGNQLQTFRKKICCLDLRGDQMQRDPPKRLYQSVFTSSLSYLRLLTTTKSTCRSSKFLLITLGNTNLSKWYVDVQFVPHINPLKPELNPICYLLALLGAHHFLHVSRKRVKLLTFRLLVS